MKLSVVIPVYNEKCTIGEILRRVREVDLPKEIIVVDDFSTDGTREILQSLPPSDDLTIHYHSRNMGKGAALRTAFGVIRGDVVLVQDADLETNPAHYPELVRPILANQADVVYGSRFLNRHQGEASYWHYMGNKLLTAISNAMTGLNLSDMETCYKVFRVDILNRIRLCENRFGFEPEFTAKIARARCRVCEIPISYNRRNYREGKKIGWKDGVSTLYCILKYRFMD
jgi:glycosyltransferase involved in cell wall biosynthesis